MERKQFVAFDLLRFIAYLKVFIFHLPIVSFPLFSFLKSNGGTAVHFFFVLSGFLISYILLQEKIQSGSIDLKNFYIRRILRIWPLYYLMVAFAYATPHILELLHITVSNEGYTPDWRFSCFFLENYKMIIENDFPNTSPLVVMWSLCIEEHFYILWGILLYYLPVNYFSRVMIFSLGVSILVKWIYLKMGIKGSDVFTELYTFSLGSLAAYIFTTKDIVAGPKQRIIVVSASVLVILFQPILLIGSIMEFFLPVIYSSLFAYLIWTLCDVQSWNGNKGLTILSEWGKFTYGMYLFHTIIIMLLLKIFVMNHLDITSFRNSILFTLSAFVITLFSGFISFYYFEKPFINLKHKLVAKLT